MWRDVQMAVSKFTKLGVELLPYTLNTPLLFCGQWHLNWKDQYVVQVKWDSQSRGIHNPPVPCTNQAVSEMCSNTPSLALRFVVKHHMMGNVGHMQVIFILYIRKILTKNLTCMWEKFVTGKCM